MRRAFSPQLREAERAAKFAAQVLGAVDRLE